MKDIVKPNQQTFMKTSNVENGKVRVDKLHNSSSEHEKCGRKICTGSMMKSYIRVGTEPRSKAELLEQAKAFFDEYYTSIKSHLLVHDKKIGKKSSFEAVNLSAIDTTEVHTEDEIFNLEPHNQRWEQVVAEVEKNGTYELKETEIAYGAKLAWRNAPRCIGRMQWSKLQVFDARYCEYPVQMYDALVNHIKYATNKGNIRSAITVFRQRTDGKHDFRIWNPQLIMYAGYKQPDESIIGDPANVDFTDLCMELGWKGNGKQWDILPLVLSANGCDPEYFDIPDELILRVPITHPTYPRFSELNLQWYCVPAVSDMLFDIGGIEFTAAPFNGWYMGTEIGARDFCDANRFNILKDAAEKFGFDTSSPITLWKDKALVEVNVAVLHSFKEKNITIMDHHTTSEIFMRHFENEHRVRGGCPADWVWLTPPMSGSITPVFHQEMISYSLKPSYEYQERASKTHVWQKKSDNNKRKKKLTFREVVRAVKFATHLYSKALSNRIKVTIIYATENGKSMEFAEIVKSIFEQSFNVKHCIRMDDYDIVNLAQEQLVIYVCSTFGNGDPPTCGKQFAKHLLEMKVTGEVVPTEHTLEEKKVAQMTRAFSASTPTKKESNGYFTDSDTLGPLANVRYAVFALGSSAYPNFCGFGKFLHNLMTELSAESLMDITFGDELCGQETAFHRWSKKIFQTACEHFCLSYDLKLVDDNSPRMKKLKIATASNPPDFQTAMSKISSKEVFKVKLLYNEYIARDPDVERETLLVKFDISESKDKCQYKPGDHLAVYPVNRPEMVEVLLQKIPDLPDPDQPIVIQEQVKVTTITGSSKVWKDTKKLPVCSIRDALTFYLDINNTPSHDLLTIFLDYATSDEDKKELTELTTDSKKFETWRLELTPRIIDVFEMFPSAKVPPQVLLYNMPIIQSRPYSISSSPIVHKNEVHLTVAVVNYKTKAGSVRHGLCSTYLQRLKSGDHVYCTYSQADQFHLPQDKGVPIVLVGPGTGIAPFRGFWQHRQAGGKIGDIYLLFGCRTSKTLLYEEEINDMVQKGIIKKFFLAYSREKNVSKKYVQDLIAEHSREFFDILIRNKGHLYICGDVSMSVCVNDTVGDLIHRNLGISKARADHYLMHEADRYHEDIFGITLRTEEKKQSAILRAKKSIDE